MTEAQLVRILNNEPVTSTVIVAEGMGIKHRAIMELLDKYGEELNEFGLFTVETGKVDKSDKMGRPIRFAWINEGQTVFLISLMRNSKAVVKFKATLTKEFFKQRKVIASLLSQLTNPEWIEIRESGKLSRRAETDTIKEFVTYAKAQGSTYPDNYYGSLTKMENQALFIVEHEFPNLRNALSGQQLTFMSAADAAVSKALKEGMERGMYYKDIYKFAKERMLTFSEIVGKTIVPIAALQLNVQPTLFLTSNDSL